MANPPDPSYRKGQLYGKGMALTFLGGFLLSFDIPLLRLVDSDPWTIMMYRGLLLSGTLTVYWTMMQLARKPVARLINGPKGVVISTLYGLSNIAFIVAIHSTTTANVVFILAFIPLFTALLSWVFLRDAIPRSTWIAMSVATMGVVIIVWDSLGEGRLFGDLMALCATITVAAALVTTRWSGEDMSLTPALGSLISVAFAALVSTPATLAAWQWGWLGINGLLIIPLASALLALGPRYLRAPEVSLFFLVETALAPLWVWFVFSEQPSTTTLIGGSIIIAAIATNSIYLLRKPKVSTTA